MAHYPTIAELSSRLNSPAPRNAYLPSVFLLTDERRLADPLAAAEALPAGAGIILRHYDDPNRPQLAAVLARICRRRGIALLIGNDWRLADAVGADGLHLAEGLLKRGLCLPPDCRRRWLLTAAAHSPAALERAADFGADAALLSPVFASASHPGAAGMGAGRFARWTRQAPLPVYALGGVDRANIGRLRGSGAAGIAAIEGLSPSQG